MASLISACPCLMDAGIKGVCHYIKPEITYLLFIAVLGTKPKALYMLKKKSFTTELYLQSSFFFRVLCSPGWILTEYQPRMALNPSELPASTSQGLVYSPTMPESMCCWGPNSGLCVYLARILPTHLNLSLLFFFFLILRQDFCV